MFNKVGHSSRFQIPVPEQEALLDRLESAAGTAKEALSAVRPLCAQMLFDLTTLERAVADASIPVGSSGTQEPRASMLLHLKGQEIISQAHSPGA